MRVLILALLLPVLAYPAYTVREGSLVDREELADGSAQEHYSKALEHFQKKEWKELRAEAKIITSNFPLTPFADEMPYLIGISFFEEKDYEWANKHFSDYLKVQTTPKHFEDALNYKFQIAEKYHTGAKKHVMGLKSMPKWLPAKIDALEIYDEVISALPNHELAAQALFAKASLLLKQEEFRSSIEAYQTLIRKFPKHPLAAESYIGVCQVYLVQSQKEYPDPNFLDLSEINLNKFRAAFPTEAKIAVAEEMLGLMQNYYAESLWETARFFERTKKYGAAKIYYEKIKATYPYAPITKECNGRITKVEKLLQKQEAKKKKK